ncbi:MAG: adenylate cyclase [Marinibacterium sp.]|nr:adenylate cyclase [Marinibacterium sp.]
MAHGTTGPDTPPAPPDVRRALAALAASATFSGSDRLIGFLDYVVSEALAGRSGSIRAKTIALDVYGYTPDEVAQRESVVRVDAGRLRRKLDDYYTDEGSDAAIRITLPKGGYAPGFERMVSPAPANHAALPRIAGIAVAVALAVIGVMAVIWALQPDAPAPAPAATGENRTVLFDTSPERLQALNLAQDARGLIFPATDPNRLRAAAAIFQTAIDMDPAYAGGYAGASQVAGLQALVTPNPDQADMLAERATALSRQALDLAPDDAWALSASAWAAFASGNRDLALRRAEQALDLAPDDPHILEFSALIALYSGQFEQVLGATSALQASLGGPLPFVFQNARSAAYFHMGDYQAAVDGFDAAIAAGAPLGPVTVSYLMAASAYLSQHARARDLVRTYQSTWPEQRVDLLFERLFFDPELGAQLGQGMRAAGWQPPQ